MPCHAHCAPSEGKGQVGSGQVRLSQLTNKSTSRIRSSWCVTSRLRRRACANSIARLTYLATFCRGKRSRPGATTTGTGTGTDREWQHGDRQAGQAGRRDRAGQMRLTARGAKGCLRRWWCFSAREIVRFSARLCDLLRLRLRLRLGQQGGRSGDGPVRSAQHNRVPVIGRLLGQVGRVDALAVVLHGRQVLQQVHVHLWTDKLV